MNFNSHNFLLSLPAVSCCSRHGILLCRSNSCFYSFNYPSSTSSLGSTIHLVSFHSSPDRVNLDLTQHPVSVSNESDVVSPDNKIKHKSNTTAHNNIVNILSVLGSDINNKTDSGHIIVNDKTQKSFEYIILDKSKEFVDDKNIQLIGGINPQYLSSSVHKFIEDRRPALKTYIESLIRVGYPKKDDYEEFINTVIRRCGFAFIENLCLYIFLGILSKQNTSSYNLDGDLDEDSPFNENLLNRSIEIGRSMINKYLRNVMNTMYDSKEKPKFSLWLDIWGKENINYNKLLTDQGDKLCSSIGALVIDILDSSTFIKQPLIRTGKKSTHYELHVSDDQLKSQLDNQKMFIIPSKLPMIVPPKDYSNTNSYGGYLLNDIKYKEDLFIDKKRFINFCYTSIIRIFYIFIYTRFVYSRDIIIIIIF